MPINAPGPRLRSSGTFRPGRVIALAIVGASAQPGRRGPTRPVAFAVPTFAYTGDEQWLERWFQPLSNGALFLIALVSVLIGKPFALQYAREQAPPEVQESPRFTARP